MHIIKVYWMWEFIVCVFCSPALSSNCPLNCICSYSGMMAQCRLGAESDYTAIRNLPHHITQLVCYIEGHFLENRFQIEHLVGMEKLVLSSDTHLNKNSVSNKLATLGFSRNIFQGLNNLIHLEVHLSLLVVNPEILVPLEKLQVLDLSNTEGLSAGYIVSLLARINTARLPLVSLNLTRVHVRGILTGTVFEPINVRTHIYQHLNNIRTLKSLDIRGNGVVQLQPGLSEFIPNLEELYVGDNVVTYFSTPRVSVLCSALDAMVHPTLRKIYLAFVPVVSPRSRRSVVLDTTDVIDVLQNGFSRCGTFDICGVLNCICQGETTIPCPFVDDQRLHRILTPAVEDNCIANLRLPLPPNLEELILRAAPSSTETAKISQNTNYCFLSDNKLRNLDMSKSNLDYSFLEREVGITGLPHLASINLEFNNLDLLKTSKWFTGATVKTLLLGGNMLVGNDTETGRVFAGVPGLEVLRLSQCQMTVMPPVDYLGNLVELDVSGNRLTTFSANMGSLPRLRKLDLSGNGISSLPHRVTDALDRLAENGTTVVVDLSDNPLLCQCPSLGFVSWIQRTRVKLSRNQSLLCTSMSGALVSPWSVDLSEQDRNCTNFYPILYSVLSCIFLAAVVGAGVLLYKKQWTLRFWLHAAKEGWRRRQERRVGGSGIRKYKYDAFVAYCTREATERKWVHLTMVPKLEGEYGLKVCIHHRDFLPGRDISDNIVDSINASRKTLLVLSPSFLDSDWCNFEVRMARVKLVEERRDNMVLVLYKPLDIPGVRLPRKLTSLLDKKTYAEWTDDPEGQQLFWNKLASVLRQEAPLHAQPYAAAMPK